MGRVSHSKDTESFIPGRLTITMQEAERKLLLALVDRQQQVDITDAGDEKLSVDGISPHERHFWWQRLAHRLKGYSIENGNFDMDLLHKKCPGCDGVYINLRNHRRWCAGKQLSLLDME